MSTRDSCTADEADDAERPTSGNQLNQNIQTLLLQYEQGVDEVTMNNENEIKDLQKSLDSVKVAVTAQSKNLTDLQMQYSAREQELEKEMWVRESFHYKSVDSRKLLKVLKNLSVMETEEGKKFGETLPQVDAQLLQGEQKIRDGRAEMEHRKLNHAHTLDLLEQELEESKNKTASLRAHHKSSTENTRSTIAVLNCNIVSMQRQLEDRNTQISNMNCHIEQYLKTNALKKEELLKLKEDVGKVSTAHSNDTKVVSGKILEQKESTLKKKYERAALQDELAIQEELTKEIAERNTQLQETLLVLEDENTKDNDDFKEKLRLHDTAMEELNNLKNEECEVIEKLNNVKQKLEEAKNEFISSEEEVKLLKEKRSGMYWTDINNQKEWERERKNLLNNIDTLKGMEDARAVLVGAVEAHTAELAAIALLEEEGSKARDSQIGELKERLSRKAQDLVHNTQVLEQVRCALKVTNGDCAELKKINAELVEENRAHQRRLAAMKGNIKTMKEEKQKQVKINKQCSREIAAVKEQVSSAGEVLKERKLVLAKKTEAWAQEEAKLRAELEINLDEVKALNSRAEHVKLQLNIKLDKREADPEKISEECEAAKMADLQKSKNEHKQLLGSYNSTITELRGDLKGVTEAAAKMEKSNKDNLVKIEALKIKIDAIQDT